jgi:hypothetical protein
MLSASVDAVDVRGDTTMKRQLLIALLAAGIGATVAMAAGAFAGSGAPNADRAQAAFQPDTSSPRWKALTDDVGVWLRDDDRLGLRARLFVRVDGTWHPVATDGAGDVLATIPLK